MFMQTEIIKIIEGGLEKNRDKVQSYATLLAEKLRSDGEDKLADRITNILTRKSVHPVYLDEFISKPVDQDTRLNMVDVFYPEEKNPDRIIISDFTKLKIEAFIKNLKYKNELVSRGVHLPNSLLLFGPPGCGKTSLAKYVSSETKLPLITAKLDGVVSSLLGNTAKNIRQVFEYASGRPCILFLDEFDAIAKARNDENEIGELKRVVNSLLQNIDDFISSDSDNILIAATNHETLLDTAVWRRFTTVIEVPKPTHKEIPEIVNLFLCGNDLSFKFDKQINNKLSALLGGLTPSDIKTICYNAIRDMVISEKNTLTYADIVFQNYLFRGYQSSDNVLIKYLKENGVTQSEMASLLKISMRQLRKMLNEKGENENG